MGGSVGARPRASQRPHVCFQGKQRCTLACWRDSSSACGDEMQQARKRAHPTSCTHRHDRDSQPTCAAARDAARKGDRGGAPLRPYQRQLEPQEVFDGGEEGGRLLQTRRERGRGRLVCATIATPRARWRMFLAISQAAACRLQQVGRLQESAQEQIGVRERDEHARGLVHRQPA